MSASPTARFFGGLLMAVGGLIAGLCGLCTVGFEISFIVEAVQSGSHSMLGDFFTPILVGTVPILIGVGLFLWGRSLFRGRRVP